MSETKGTWIDGHVVTKRTFYMSVISLLTFKGRNCKQALHSNFCFANFPDRVWSVRASGQAATKELFSSFLRTLQQYASCRRRNVSLFSAAWFIHALNQSFLHH